MRNDLAEDLKKILAEVDRYYQSYHKLTNDELRDVSSRLERKVSCSNDKNIVLDAILPEVFALVKETALRFSLGDIEVQANDFDCYLSKNTDFVKIIGDKAIYLNRWDTGGQTVAWDMVHYDEQIMGGILLHRGLAVEMATGEGKTLVATLPVFLNALTHQGVHIMTVNDYLSKRDFLITRPIYLFHGLSVGCVELFNRKDERYKSAYDSDITFGKNSTFVFDYLYDNMALTPSECVQRGHNFAIIDELDSILIDDADVPHIIGGGNYYDTSEDYKKYLPLVKEFLDDESDDLYVKDELQNTVRLTSAGKSWFENKTEISGLYEVEKTYEVPDFDSLSKIRKDEIYDRLRLQNVIKQLLAALTVYNLDEDYIVYNGEIKIIDQNTGRLKPSSRWEYGLHTAIEVKENVKPKLDFDSMAVISLKNYYRLYDKVSGMSGTIMAVSDELEEIYGLKCECLPTHKPVIRTDEPMRVYRTSEIKIKAIIERIQSNFRNGRPSLVSSISLVKSNHMADVLSSAGLNFFKLDAKTLKEESMIVSKAGIGNNITVSTNIAGRGTDIKPSSDALANGGLDVIGTEIFGDSRINNQLRGRTGRQGNPGSSVFFTSLEDDILKYLTKEERMALSAVAETVHSDDLSGNSEILTYFKKAQDSYIDLRHKQRKTTAQKDDIVALRRKKFYEQRERLLFDDDAQDILIKRMIDKGLIKPNEIDSHLFELYTKVKNLAMKILSNNQESRKELLPFSDKRHLYAVCVDVRKVSESYKYFRKEYIRQVILQVYDCEWKKFVLYMMEDLDQYEVDKLDEKFDVMLNTIDSIIVSRITNASIPVGHTASVSKNGNNSNKVTIGPVPEGIEPNALCPCGSGKKFCECHGNGTHKNRSRR